MHDSIERCFPIRGEVVATRRVEVTDIRRVPAMKTQSRMAAGLPRQAAGRAHAHGARRRGQSEQAKQVKDMAIMDVAPATVAAV